MYNVIIICCCIFTLCIIIIYMGCQVVSCAERLVAQIQDHIDSEQDTNPLVSDSIQAQFEDKEKLLQLAGQLGELKFREFISLMVLVYILQKNVNISTLPYSTSSMHRPSSQG